MTGHYLIYMAPTIMTGLFALYSIRNMGQYPLDHLIHSV